MPRILSGLDFKDSYTTAGVVKALQRRMWDCQLLFTLLPGFGEEPCSWLAGFLPAHCLAIDRLSQFSDKGAREVT